MTFNQIFDRDEDEYLDGDELLYWVRNFIQNPWKSENPLKSQNFYRFIPWIDQIAMIIVKTEILKVMSFVILPRNWQFRYKMKFSKFLGIQADHNLSFLAFSWQCWNSCWWSWTFDWYVRQRWRWFACNWRDCWMFWSFYRFSCYWICRST